MDAIRNKISEDKKSAVRKYNDGHGVDISANPDAIKQLEALR